MIPLPFYIFKRHSVPGEISCFRDYGQKPALSLLYYFEIQKDKIRVKEEEKRKKELRVKQGAGTVLVEALTKKGIIKEAAEKFGVEADDINLVYNSGKNVEENFSVREYKKEINATKRIHARDRLFIILKNEDR